jgi:hypothetical protein
MPAAGRWRRLLPDPLEQTTTLFSQLARVRSVSQRECAPSPEHDRQPVHTCRAAMTENSADEAGLPDWLFERARHVGEAT